LAFNETWVIYTEIHSNGAACVARHSVCVLVRVLKVAAMLVKSDFSVFQTTKWHEYATRFLLGGAVTAAAGVIAKQFGPTVGGLFLAFPAIFPASATLIEKHATERGRRERSRGRHLAGVEAAGAAMGSIGLLSFACIFRMLILRLDLWAVFIISTLAWAGVSGALWASRKWLKFCHALRS
jgi:hypothetical protein